MGYEWSVDLGEPSALKEVDVTYSRNWSNGWRSVVVDVCPSLWLAPRAMLCVNPASCVPSKPCSPVEPLLCIFFRWCRTVGESVVTFLRADDADAFPPPPWIWGTVRVVDAIMNHSRKKSNTERVIANRSYSSWRFVRGIEGYRLGSKLELQAWSALLHLAC